MELAQILDRDAVMPSVKVTSQKQLFQDLAARAAEVYGLDAREIIDGLIEREKLGSTAMGRGVAIPHARASRLDRIVAVFARLDRPIEFDAVDGQPVDLVLMLLAPEESGADRLRALARCSRLLRSIESCDKLRATTKADALYALLTEPQANAA